MELSLILMVWNTSHLMARTLYTLQKQTIVQPWELIIIDDNSEDDVVGTLDKYGQGLPIKYIRLEHNMGMRGNTFSLNRGIEEATGRVLMWSTPEVMLPPLALESVLLIPEEERRWVTIPSHGLTAEVQLKIDTVDWKSDIHNLKKLIAEYNEESWNSIWFNLNFHVDGRPSRPHKTTYGNNQTVAVDRLEWMKTIKSFPYFLDYGTDDPWISAERIRHGYQDITFWEQEAYHQWHATCQYWMAQDKAPNWNKFGHTTSNILNDPRVSPNGTCSIWDGGNTSPMSEEEKKEALKQHNYVIATGFRPKQITY